MDLSDWLIDPIDTKPSPKEPYTNHGDTEPTRTAFVEMPTLAMNT